MDDVIYASPTGILSLTWLLIALPAAGAIALLLAGKAADKWGHWLGVATVAAAFGLGLAQTIALAGLSETAVFSELYTFLTVGDVDIQASLLLDPLSAAFVLLITGVGSLIHIYAVGYMRHAWQSLSSSGSWRSACSSAALTRSPSPM